MSQESSHSPQSGPSVASSDDPKKPRVITLLIDDLRSDESELAEVRVPLKPTPGGYWADAKEVSKALQASASKLDGKTVYSFEPRQFVDISHQDPLESMLCGGNTSRSSYE